jgi:hypothetical protein
VRDSEIAGQASEPCAFIATSVRRKVNVACQSVELGEHHSGSNGLCVPQADTSTPDTAVNRQVFLAEEEISDVSLATFYVFDEENAGSLKPGVQLARGGCGGGGGCGHVAAEAAEASEVVARVAVAEVAESASALEVAAAVDAEDAAWAGGDSTA